MNRNTESVEANTRGDGRAKIGVAFCVLLLVPLIIFCGWEYHLTHEVLYIVLLAVNVGSLGINIFNWLHYLCK